jgi:hypothetical protein
MAENEKTICFDHSHNNKLSIENSSYSDFIDFMFASGFKIGHIKQGITLEKLKVYDLFIIGSPFGMLFDQEEIDIIHEYVKHGGSLFIIKDGGGDHENETNINDITQNFGFKFNNDIVYDSMKYIRLQERPIVDTLEPHPVTQGVNSFVHSSGSSIEVDETFNSDKNIEINVVAYSGLNSFLKTFDGEKYIEEDLPKNPVIVAIKFFNGRIIGMGNTSIFSSLSSSYGYLALDNNILLANIINWLVSAKDKDGIDSSVKLISIPMNYSLYLWMEKLVKRKKWKKITDLLNFSVKYVKDNYDKVMEESKEARKKLTQLRRSRTIAKKKEKKADETQREEALKESEDAILELMDDRERDEEDQENLDQIMKELSKFEENHEEKSNED